MKTRNVTWLQMLLFIIVFIPLTRVYGQSGLNASQHFTLEKLADGVFAAIHKNEGGYAICNAGIIDLGDKTIVLDPFFSPAAARDLKQHAESLTGKPVSIVINLDPHSDHTNGNQVFVPGANIISTPNARRYIEDHFSEEFEYNKKTAPGELQKVQEKLKYATGNEKVELTLWEDEYKALIESLPELKMTLPDVTINDTLVIYGSKRRVIVIPTGTGHTNGDMIVYLPAERIIFVSDQLFVKCHPYFGDGNPESLKRNLKQMIDLNPQIVVPGHGPVGNVNSVHMMIDYIETLTGMVRKEIQKGADENKIMQLMMPERYNDWLISSFYKINLRFLYRRLVTGISPE